MAMLFPPHIAPSWFDSHGGFQGPFAPSVIVSDGMEMWVHLSGLQKNKMQSMNFISNKFLEMSIFIINSLI